MSLLQSFANIIMLLSPRPRPSIQIKCVYQWVQIFFLISAYIKLLLSLKVSLTNCIVCQRKFIVLVRLDLCTTSILQIYLRLPNPHFEFGKNKGFVGHYLKKFTVDLCFVQKESVSSACVSCCNFFKHSIFITA